MIKSILPESLLGTYGKVGLLILQTLWLSLFDLIR